MNTAYQSFTIIVKAAYWGMIIICGLLNISVLLSMIFFLVSIPWNSFAFGILFIACMIFIAMAPSIWKSDRRTSKRTLAVLILVVFAYALFIRLKEERPLPRFIVQEEKIYPYDHKTILSPSI